MTEIIIDDGLEDYTFKNKRGEVFASFAFNPTDVQIIERYNEVVKFFENYSMNDEDSIEELSKLDEVLKEQFNKLLNRDVASGLFATYAPTTVMGNGDFYAEICLDKIAEFIEKASDARLKKKQARIKKHTAKYSE